MPGAKPELRKEIVGKFSRHFGEVLDAGPIEDLGSYLPSGLFDNRRIADYVEHNLARNDVPNDFRQHKLRTGKSLYVVATNLNTAQGVVFGHDEDYSVSISESVQASTAIPGFFKPARIGPAGREQDYLDGALRKTANISTAARHGAELIVCYNPFRPFGFRTLRQQARRTQPLRRPGRQGPGTGAGRLGRIGLFAAGVLGFTLLEYLLHRFAFHWDPGNDPKARVRLFLMHGLHHEFPNDRLRLVAPPLMSWPIGVVLFTVDWLLLPHTQAFILFGGTCAGYLFYDWTHYYTHHFRNPKTRVGKLLRRAHAVHHFKLFNLNMGISSPLWDWAFGTFAWSEETMRAALKETKKLEAESDEAERRARRTVERRAT